MQAIILAAGMGKRLKELTSNKTKCMVKVNGVSLIDRMLHQIEKYSLNRIVIVVGYEGQHLMDYIGTLGIKTRYMIRQITFTHWLLQRTILKKTTHCFSSQTLSLKML